MSLSCRPLQPVGFHGSGQLHRLHVQLHLLVPLRILDSLCDEGFPSGLSFALHVPLLHLALRHLDWLGDGQLARRHAELEVRGASPEVGLLQLPFGFHGDICRVRMYVQYEFAAFSRHMPHTVG